MDLVREVGVIMPLRDLQEVLPGHNLNIPYLGSSV